MNCDSPLLSGGFLLFALFQPTELYYVWILKSASNSEVSRIIIYIFRLLHCTIANAHARDGFVFVIEAEPGSRVARFGKNNDRT